MFLNLKKFSIKENGFNSYLQVPSEPIDTKLSYNFLKVL